jgi:hypothetical protein
MFVEINFFLPKNDPDPTVTNLPTSLLFQGPLGTSFVIRGRIIIRPYNLNPQLVTNSHIRIAGGLVGAKNLSPSLEILLSPPIGY